MRTRSQQYAEQVYQLVDDLLKLKMSGDAEKRYGALCHSFPFIVRENGLVAAFGFLAAKAEGASEVQSPESLLFAHYVEMLGLNDQNKLLDPEKICEEIAKKPITEYCHLTQKTLMLAKWFKYYAEGILKVDATGVGEGENSG